MYTQYQTLHFWLQLSLSSRKSYRIPSFGQFYTGYTRFWELLFSVPVTGYTYLYPFWVRLYPFLVTWITRVPFSADYNSITKCPKEASPNPDPIPHYPSRWRWLS